MKEISVLKKIEAGALEYPEKAKKLSVTNNESLSSANTFLVSIKRMRREINNAFDPIIKKAHEAHREALATKKRYDQPLIEAEMIVKPLIASYMAELARKRREAEEATRRAEEERRRKEAERIAAAVDESEADGDVSGIAEILSEDEPEIKPVEYVPAPKLEGTSIRKIWKWKVVDIDKIPREYLIVNPNMISAEMRDKKGETNIPGIQVYSEDSVSTRGGYG